MSQYKGAANAAAYGTQKGTNMKKEKTLTPEQLLKLSQKRQKEIAKWEREQARPKRGGYLFYLVIIVSLIYITDEIASQIGTQMKTEIANDLFARFGEGSVGVADLLSMLTLPIMAISVFYKTFADRYGRKIFLVINTLGMGLGMLIIFLSDSIVAYFIGAMICAFFVPHDMQVVYIMETSPKEHRAKIYSIIKCIATLGVMLIPLFRRMFMHSVGEWRMVYLVPAIIGLAIGLVALLAARETDAFIESRLKYLRMTNEEREAIKREKDAKDAQGGVKAALKFAFGHKQLKWLYIIAAYNSLAILITTYYQVVMSYGYANHYVSTGAYATLETALDAAGVGPVTTALFLFPVGSALMQFIVGFISDKWGRKPAAVLRASLSLASFVLFAIGAGLAWPPYLVGFLCGASVGAYYSTTDINGMMISESSPTNLRSSILSAQMIAMAAGMIPAYLIGAVLIAVLGNAATAVIALCIAVPSLAVGLIALLTKTHDTKGMDLETVTGCEWDDGPKQPIA